MLLVFLSDALDAFGLYRVDVIDDFATSVGTTNSISVKVHRDKLSRRFVTFLEVGNHIQC